MTTEVTTSPQRPSVIARIANRYGVDPAKLLGTLKATVFRTEKSLSDEQMLMMLVVADQYHLNPLLKEIYAFPDKGGIIPVIGVDGWIKLIQAHPQFDGIAFESLTGTEDPWCTCTIFRRDQSHPTVVTEYLAECKRNTQPWTSHPRRLLRHKALIQCARIAFGFSGVFDPDEAERIASSPSPDKPSAGLASLRATIAAAPAPQQQLETIEAVTGEISPPDAFPDDAPPVMSYAEYAEELKNATSQEGADLLLDEAKFVLPPEQYAELVTVHKRKFK